MRLRLHALPRLALGLSLASVTACGARTQLEEARASVDAGCAPGLCDADHHWDASSCSCVRARCADDATQAKIASISTEFADGLAITVRDGEVFWATRAGKSDADGTVSKVSRCGGAVTTLAAGLYGPTSVAVGGGRVFFGTMGDGATGLFNGSLQSVAIAGGPVSTVAPGTVYLGGVAADDRYVYWTRYGTGYGAWKLPVDGGSPVALAPDQAFSFIAVDATRVFLSQPASIPGNSKLLSAPLGGGELKVLVDSDLVFPGVMAIDDTSVYCVLGDLRLSRVPKDGGATTSLARAEVNGLAVDATDVYWAQGDATSGTPGAIMRVPKGGGSPTTLSKTLGYAIAIDETYVYWLLGGDVYRLPK
jgi:hypothetical protein